MTKNPDWKMFFSCQLIKTLWSSLAFKKLNKYSQTITAAVDWNLGKIFLIVPTL